MVFSALHASFNLHTENGTDQLCLRYRYVINYREMKGSEHLQTPEAHDSDIASLKTIDEMKLFEAKR